MKKWRQITALCMAAALLSTQCPVMAETQDMTEAVETIVAEETEASAQEKATAEETEAPAQEETAQESPAEPAKDGQLTMKDLTILNGGRDCIYSHDGKVTFVDGTCTEHPVENAEDAEAVVESMMTLIGADANTEFIPWRDVRDPMGNTYYIFQQIYFDTTVCGGAVKVITDADGTMTALSSSVESEMPAVDEGTGIDEQEAEEIVRNHESQTSRRSLEILDDYTDVVILPSADILDTDSETLDESSRFAWVVYSNNPSGSVQDSSDLPYLAHYVTLTGEYLYEMPAIIPGDEAGQSGYDSSYVFEFMEPVEYTGYVDLSDGTEKEISVTVMRDKRTGMYYLANPERRIMVANCYDFLYGDGQIVLESSPDNLEWDQTGLLSLYNYCRAWDYYQEIGWNGGDGAGTPILILNNFCDDHFNEIDNACYIGKIYGMQCFAASKINDYSQCLDVISHEFTHCVTGSLMTYNSYMNDYGAINEAMSDIQGKNCEMLAGDVDPDNWWLGANSLYQVRNMEDPHLREQPEYTWDLYYQPNVATPTSINDQGGVHTNSSLLNKISWSLIEEGGMSLEEARIFWFMVDCAMVPQTDYAQLAELLPWVLKAAGMQQYDQCLAEAIETTRLGLETMPETMDEDYAIITLNLPDTEAFDTENWIMNFRSVKVDEIVSRVMSLADQLMNHDFSSLPKSIQEEIAEVEETLDYLNENKGEVIKELPGIALDLLGTLFSEDTEENKEGTEENIEEEPALREASGFEDKLGEMLTDLLTWLKAEINEVHFSAMGGAGQDGSTLRMVVRSGRSIPMLMHMVVPEGSEVPDQMVLAVYLNGKWYGMPSPEQMEDDQLVEEFVNEVINDIFGADGEKLKNIKGFEDFLDLITVDVQGGQTVELSAEGLEEIVIPDPTPAEERAYGTIEPGRKSRPKTDTEETAEEDETTQQETAEEDETAQQETAEEDEAAQQEAA